MLRAKRSDVCFCFRRAADGGRGHDAHVPKRKENAAKTPWPQDEQGDEVDAVRVVGSGRAGLDGFEAEVTGIRPSQNGGPNRLS